MNAVRIVQRVLRLLGLSITRHPSPDTLPWRIKQILSMFSVDEIIDVGAHEGEFATMLRTQVEYRGSIVSFEPHAPSYAILQNRFSRDPKWAGHQLAVGTENSAGLTINCFENTSMNSVLAPNATGLSRFGGLASLGTEKVSAVRLDAFPLSSGPLLLKSDTQGHDLQVLEGAAGLLGRVVALVVELSAKPIYDGIPSMTQMVIRINELGFEPVGFFPVSRDHDRLRVLEFDGLFVRGSS